MLKYLFSKAFAMFAFVALTAACTFGQAVNNAQIHGVITDPGGGAIIGASTRPDRTLRFSAPWTTHSQKSEMTVRMLSLALAPLPEHVPMGFASVIRCVGSIPPPSQQTL